MRFQRLQAKIRYITLKVISQYGRKNRKDMIVVSPMIYSLKGVLLLLGVLAGLSSGDAGGVSGGV
jgi:hypothetical protein